MTKPDRQYSRETLLSIYTVMKQIRLFEETAFRFFQENISFSSPFISK